MECKLIVEYLRKINLGTKVSFVLYLIDDYTGECARADWYKVIFPYYCTPPLYKQDGFIVFSGIPDGDYTVNILSERYYNEEKVIHVSSEGKEPSINYISLKPTPSYLFDSKATLIRFAVVDEYNSPIKNVLVRAEMLTLDCMKGKLAKASVKKGDKEFYISSVTGKLSVGDQYYVGVESENRDVAVIEEQLEDARHYRTRFAFKFDHDKGAPLMPLLETITDDRGEAVVYFRSLPVKYFSTNLVIDYQGKYLIKEVKMEEGKTTYLENITL